MTQRKRAIGFALMDTAFAADAKFVRLARKATNEVGFAASVGVFWLILADARRARSSVVNWEDYTEYTEQITALKDAKLLTVNGFDGETFDRWAPAYRVPSRTSAYPRVPNGTNGTGDSEHEAYPDVPDGIPSTESTVTSPLIKSDHLTSPPTKDARPKDDTFMRWGGKGLHDGRHGKDCSVCAPLLPSEKVGS